MTDFGYRDPYVGIMKSVMLDIDPSIRFIELTQGIPSFDLRAAAYVLSSAWPYLPRDTVVLAVVDPGVGSERRELIAENDAATIVTPDNGLISLLEARTRRAGRSLTFHRAHHRVLETLAARKPEYAATFDGRDLFAPLAARIAALGPANLRGRAVRPLLLDHMEPAPVEAGDITGMEGHVVHIDTFGNTITTITAVELAEIGDPTGAKGTTTLSVYISPSGDDDWVEVPFARTFSDVPEGHAVAYTGSAGHLELAIREGSFSRRFGVGQQSPVRVFPRTS
jgi:S-adenosylmethionine hydrolase